jgi:hypothetical protein
MGHADRLGGDASCNVRTIRQVFGRMGRRLKPVFVLVMCLLCQGCVGVASMSSTRTAISNPVLSDAASLNGLSQVAATNTRSNSDYTAQWLEAHWGKPSTLRPESGGGGGELWTYKFGNAWRGVVPMLIIPIPLILPTGSEKITLVVRHGRVVSADQFGSRFSGAGAGLLGPDGRPWAGTWNERLK